MWLRDDVFATHGHYLDAHIAIPTLERLAAGAMARLVGAIPDPATPDDYEAVLAPIYALSHASAQRGAPGKVTVGSRSAVGTWRALAGNGRARKLRGYALAPPFRLSVMAANRAGFGPVQAQIGVEDIRHASLVAMAETARRLRVAPAHLLFGHTHRVGQLAADDPLEWRTPGGHAAAQHRLLGLRDAVHEPRPAPVEPLLAGRRDRARRRRAAARGAPARRRHGGAAQPSCPGVNCTAWQRTPSPTASCSTPVVWRSCSMSG